MENLCVNGDYVPDGFGGFTRLQGTQALLQRALFKLGCKRGSFPFLPELGSRLYMLGREKPAARSDCARQYALEALSGMDVTVTDTKVVSLPDGRARVTVQLCCENETAALEVTV